MILWTDGSANPNPGPGGFAVIREGIPVVMGYEKDSTNIRMEGAAIISAIRYANGESLEINTDSEFWLNVLTKWAPTWEENGWKKKKGEIQNLEMVQLAYELYMQNDVKLVWTRGHVGTEFNEKADEWANMARKKKCPKGFIVTDPILTTINVVKETK
ncbi:MAG: ribonuclease H [Candidatus Saccharibacteria bacterium]|nr:ribonuclease H [Candidatus Saccharibacteria bacterium]